MNYKGHISVGILFSVMWGILLFILDYQLGLVGLNYFLYSSAYGIPAMFWIALVVAHGSLVPDIDIQTSKGFKWSLLLLIGLIFLLIWQQSISVLVGLVILVAFLLFCVFSKHRGFTHGLTFVLLYSGMLFFMFGYDWIIASFGFWATVSHLVAD